MSCPEALAAVGLANARAANPHQPLAFVLTLIGCDVRRRNRHMLHEFVKPAHMIASEMRGLSRLVAPALCDPDQTGNAGVFRQAILQAAIKRLDMRGVQDDAPAILRKIIWLNFHETLDDNHSVRLTVGHYFRVNFLSGVADLLVMADHFVDNKTQKFLRKIRVKFCIARQLAQTLNLPLFTRGICRRQC
jgi:hypothetical protein